MKIYCDIFDTGKTFNNEKSYQFFKLYTIEKILQIESDRILFRLFTFSVGRRVFSGNFIVNIYLNKKTVQCIYFVFHLHNINYI